jgi:hypothetical protein
MNKYEEMSLEELETLRLEKMESVRIAKDDLAEVSSVYDRKARAAELARKLGGLSPEDLALLQEMMPDGVPTEENVGVPGQ